MGRAPLRRLGSIASASLLLLGLGCGGGTESAGGPRAPLRRQVIFVLLDAARADRFSFAGYERRTTPNLDALAARGVVFTRHYAADTQTRGSLPSLLYSRHFAPALFPPSPRVPLSRPYELFEKLDRQAISLPRALAAARFETAAISAHSWTRSGSGFAAEFQEFVSLPEQGDVDRRLGYPPAEAVTDAAIEWLRQRRNRDYVLYLHYMDTHFPHRLTGEARRLLRRETIRAARGSFDADGRPLSEGRALTGADRAYLDALYDADLRTADAELGRLFDFLTRRGELDHTLIVVTSDHGEHLLEAPGRFEHGGDWLEALARVPLVIHFPSRLQPGRHDGPTESVDVLPTVLSLLDLPMPPGRSADGRDLLPVLRGAEAGRDHAVSQRGIRKGRYLLAIPNRARDAVLFWLEGGEPDAPPAVSGRLFDVAADPLQTTNLWAERPDIVADLLDTYHRRLSRPYRRFVAARRNRPPAAGFAVAARDFVTRPAASIVQVSEHDLHEPRPGDPHWRLSTDWEDFGLLGLPGAGPMEVSFQLPDGRYRLTVAMRGGCRIQVPGSPWRRLRAVPPKGEPAPATPARPELVPYGEITVTHRQLVATIEPLSPDEALLIRYLGFEPEATGAGTPSRQEAEQIEERLRALGYLD